MPGGVLAPFSDMDAECVQKYKNGGVYEVEIKRSRNPQFMGKVFAFFHFCFEHWTNEEGREHLSDKAQFDVFRKHLTVLAGYYDSFHGIDGRVRIEAKSLAYSSMSEGEFQECYSALIRAALKHIFFTMDKATERRLVSFF